MHLSFKLLNGGAHPGPPDGKPGKEAINGRGKDTTGCDSGMGPNLDSSALPWIGDGRLLSEAGGRVAASTLRWTPSVLASKGNIMCDLLVGDEAFLAKALDELKSKVQKEGDGGFGEEIALQILGVALPAAVLSDSDFDLLVRGSPPALPDEMGRNASDSSALPWIDNGGILSGAGRRVAASVFRWTPSALVGHGGIARHLSVGHNALLFKALGELKSKVQKEGDGRFGEVALWILGITLPAAVLSVSDYHVLVGGAPPALPDGTGRKASESSALLWIVDGGLLSGAGRRVAASTLRWTPSVLAGDGNFVCDLPVGDDVFLTRALDELKSKVQKEGDEGFREEIALWILGVMLPAAVLSASDFHLLVGGAPPALPDGTGRNANEATALQWIDDGGLLSEAGGRVPASALRWTPSALASDSGAAHDLPEGHDAFLFKALAKLKAKIQKEGDGGFGEVALWILGITLPAAVLSVSDFHLLIEGAPPALRDGTGRNANDSSALPWIDDSGLLSGACRRVPASVFRWTPPALVGHGGIAHDLPVGHNAFLFKALDKLKSKVQKEGDGRFGEVALWILGITLPAGVLSVSDFDLLGRRAPPALLDGTGLNASDSSTLQWIVDSGLLSGAGHRVAASALRWTPSALASDGSAAHDLPVGHDAFLFKALDKLKTKIQKEGDRGFGEVALSILGAMLPAAVLSVSDFHLLVGRAPPALPDGTGRNASDSSALPWIVDGGLLSEASGHVPASALRWTPLALAGDGGAVNYLPVGHDVSLFEVLNEPKDKVHKESDGGFGEVALGIPGHPLPAADLSVSNFNPLVGGAPPALPDGTGWNANDSSALPWIDDGGLLSEVGGRVAALTLRWTPSALASDGGVAQDLSVGYDALAKIQEGDRSSSLPTMGLSSSNLKLLVGGAPPALPDGTGGNAISGGASGGNCCSDDGSAPFLRSTTSKLLSETSGCAAFSLILLTLFFLRGDSSSTCNPRCDGFGKVSKEGREGLEKAALCSLGIILPVMELFAPTMKSGVPHYTKIFEMLTIAVVTVATLSLMMEHLGVGNHIIVKKAKRCYRSHKARGTWVAGSFRHRVVMLLSLLNIVSCNHVDWNSELLQADGVNVMETKQENAADGGINNAPSISKIALKSTRDNRVGRIKTDGIYEDKTSANPSAFSQGVILSSMEGSTDTANMHGSKEHTGTGTSQEKASFSRDATIIPNNIYALITAQESTPTSKPTESAKQKCKGNAGFVPGDFEDVLCSEDDTSNDNFKGRAAAIGTVITDTVGLIRERSWTNFGSFLKSGVGVAAVFAPTVPWGALITPGIAIITSFFPKDKDPPSNKDVMENITKQLNAINKKLGLLNATIHDGFREQEKAFEEIKTMIELLQRTTSAIYKQLWIDPLEKIHAAYTNLLQTYMPKVDNVSWDDFFTKANKYRHELDLEVYNAFDVQKIKQYLLWLLKDGVVVNNMGMCGQAIEFQFIATIRFELLQICLFGSFERIKDCDGKEKSCWLPDRSLQSKYLDAYMKQMKEWEFQVLNAKRFDGLGIGHLVGMSRSEFLLAYQTKKMCFPCIENGKTFGPTKNDLENGLDVSPDGLQQCDTTDNGSYESCSCSCLHPREYSPGNKWGGNLTQHQKNDRHCQKDEKIYYSMDLLDKYLNQSAAAHSCPSNECRLVSKSNYNFDASTFNAAKDTAIDTAIFRNSSLVIALAKQTCANFCFPYADDKNKNLKSISVDTVNSDEFSCSCYFHSATTLTSDDYAKAECPAPSSSLTSLSNVADSKILRLTQLMSFDQIENTNSTCYEVGKLVFKVNIKTTRNVALELGEVEVLDPSGKTNWARGKPASQSSTYYDGTSKVSYPASNANNGNGAMYSRTNQGINNWWEVDIEAAKPVGSIRIHAAKTETLASLEGATITLHTPTGFGLVHTMTDSDLSASGIDVKYESFTAGMSTLMPTPSPSKRPTPPPTYKHCYWTGCSWGRCPGGYWEETKKYCWVSYKEYCCQWRT